MRTFNFVLPVNARRLARPRPRASVLALRSSSGDALLLSWAGISLNLSQKACCQLRKHGRGHIEYAHYIVAGESQVRRELLLLWTQYLRPPENANILFSAEGLLDQPAYLDAQGPSGMAGPAAADGGPGTPLDALYNVRGNPQFEGLPDELASITVPSFPAKVQRLGTDSLPSISLATLRSAVPLACITWEATITPWRCSFTAHLRYATLSVIPGLFLVIGFSRRILSANSSSPLWNKSRIAAAAGHRISRTGAIYSQFFALRHSVRFQRWRALAVRHESRSSPVRLIF